MSEVIMKLLLSTKITPVELLRREEEEPENERRPKQKILVADIPCEVLDERESHETVLQRVAGTRAAGAYRTFSRNKLGSIIILVSWIYWSVAMFIILISGVNQSASFFYLQLSMIPTTILVEVDAMSYHNFAVWKRLAGCFEIYIYVVEVIFFSLGIIVAFCFTTGGYLVGMLVVVLSPSVFAMDSLSHKIKRFSSFVSLVTSIQLAAAVAMIYLNKASGLCFYQMTISGKFFETANPRELDNLSMSILDSTVNRGITLAVLMFRLAIIGLIHKRDCVILSGHMKIIEQDADTKTLNEAAERRSTTQKWAILASSPIPIKSHEELTEKARGEDKIRSKKSDNNETKPKNTQEIAEEKAEQSRHNTATTKNKRVVAINSGKKLSLRESNETVMDKLLGEHATKLYLRFRPRKTLAVTWAFAITCTTLFTYAGESGASASLSLVSTALMMVSLIDTASVANLRIIKELLKNVVTWFLLVEALLFAISLSFLKCHSVTGVCIALTTWMTALTVIFCDSFPCRERDYRLRKVYVTFFTVNAAINAILLYSRAFLPELCGTQTELFGARVSILDFAINQSLSFLFPCVKICYVACRYTHHCVVLESEVRIV